MNKFMRISLLSCIPDECDIVQMRGVFLISVNRDDIASSGCFIDLDKCLLIMYFPCVFDSLLCLE